MRKCDCQGENCYEKGCEGLISQPDKTTLPTPDNAIRFNSYAIVERAVSEGIAHGYRRAHKHVDNPSESSVQHSIEMAVMNALSEVLKLD